MQLEAVFASEIMWSDIDVEENNEVKITEMRERIYASESKDDAKSRRSW